MSNMTCQGDGLAGGTNLLTGSSNGHSVQMERGRPTRGCSQLRSAASPERGVARPDTLPRSDVTMGYDLDVGSEVQLLDPGCLFSSNKGNLKEAVEAVFQCSKGSSVAAIRLMGQKFQESSTEVRESCPIMQRTSLREGAPISGKCQWSQSDGGCERICALRGRWH